MSITDKYMMMSVGNVFFLSLQTEKYVMDKTVRVTGENICDKCQHIG